MSAPAGFGKTTLLGEWLAGGERPAAWLSMEEGDNDPTRFLALLPSSEAISIVSSVLLVDSFGTATVIGGLSFTFWLLIKGVNVEQWDDREQNARATEAARTPD